jgi:hypothetical protein
MPAYGGSEAIAAFTIGTTGRSFVKFTLRPFYLCGMSPFMISIGSFVGENICPE